MSEVVKVRQCPICHKVVPENKYRPFCSKRCADIDLGRWFNGSYAVAAQEPDESDYEELDKALAEDSEISEDNE